MTDFSCGETTICSVEWRDAAGTLTDPGTSISVQIVDPNGIMVLDWAAMTKDSTGKYHYDYTILSTAASQIYKVKFRAIDTGRTTIAQATYSVIS